MSGTDPRIGKRLDVLYTSGREEGRGALTEISDSEALLEDTGSAPHLGAGVTVYVSVPNAAESLKLLGKVSRHTEGGFAIQLEAPSPEIAVFLGEPAAAETIPTGSREAAMSEKGRPEKVNLEELELTRYEASELERLTERIAAEIERQRGESKLRRLRDEIHRLVQHEGVSLEEVLACGENPQGPSEDRS